VLNNTSGEFVETVQDLLDDAPPQGKPPGCQLKYLNGRIFYGSKIMLPAKLSFRAASIYNEQCNVALSGENLTCAHGVRAHGEKLINAAAAVDSDDAAERSEEDDASRGLVIDTTTGDEENSSSSLDMCDDVALRAHAMRLNSSYYSSGFNNATTSTPNLNSGYHSHHHPHAKKTAINFGEVSPRRQTAANVSPLSGLNKIQDTLNSTLFCGKKARCSIFKRWIVGSNKRRRRLRLTSPRSRYHVLRQRLRHKLRNRCKSLITSYGSYLQHQLDLYVHAEHVQHFHRRFLALELYTRLLVDLNMFCQSKTQVAATVSSPQQQKRQRNEDAARNRRANRQEEMLRHMLTPDSREERNRKDASK